MTAIHSAPFRLALGAALCGMALAAHGDAVPFREPGIQVYEIAAPPASPAAAFRGPDWIPARPRSGGARVELGRRVVLRLTHPPASGTPPLPSGLRVRRQVDSLTWILEAPDAPTAIAAAADLSQRRDVSVAVPTQRRASLRRHFDYAPAPDDRYFPLQYSLQTSRPTAAFAPAGADLRVRSAWPVTRGAHVVVGVADDGIDPGHPDLAPRLADAGRNFLAPPADGAPLGDVVYHGTAVAGLIAATGDNGIGISGVAPEAGLSSWVIFDEDGKMPDDAGMADTFEHDSQRVGIQNHSWGNSDFLFVGRRLLEDEAIGRAVATGRGGRGVVFVRSAGNTRDTDFNFNSGSGDANLDGYANDPRQIAVAAVTEAGRYASYSTPGACVLVAAPSGDLRTGSPGLVTTDRVGAAGLNTLVDPGDPSGADYLAGSRRFSGTSGSAPQVAGCVALLLSANPDLTWWEVPQILALSARQTDPADPDLRTNAAGFRISHNTGFGVPDAGAAVRLARAWVRQESPVEVRQRLNSVRPIPDGVTGGTPGGVSYEFPISQALAVQHVQVAVRWDHARARDIEVLLTSPGGTVSRLLRPGSAAEPVPLDWTFHSVLHLGESSRGTWRVDFLDHRSGISGRVDSVEVVLTGRAIEDADADGLDDRWEDAMLQSRSHGAGDDPDHDGWTNAAEQMAGTHPRVRETALVASLFLPATNGERPRLSWPSNGAESFEIWGTTDAGRPFTRITNAPGSFPESAWFLPALESFQVLQVRTVPE
ncbi:MAG: S8 family serine peptidase [Verrucomicrobiales bacterium]|nr:S8 family serine peptidase [Verrucomicrobiales bacterium]